MIVESLYSQVDADARELMLMKEIMDHRSDGSAVPVDNAYYVDPRQCLLCGSKWSEEPADDH
jgi:hypothetical protein